MAESSGDGPEQDLRYGRLEAKAWLDPEFKARLLAHPATVAREEGLEVPAGRQIEVVESGPERVVLTLLPEIGRASCREREDTWVKAVARDAAESAYRARLTAEPAAVMPEAGSEVPEV